MKFTHYFIFDLIKFQIKLFVKIIYVISIYYVRNGIALIKIIELIKFKNSNNYFQIINLKTKLS